MQFNWRPGNDLSRNLNESSGRGVRCPRGIRKTKGFTVEINEEIKTKMVEYLQTFEAGVKKAGEFSAEQAPLVVQEFLAWEITRNGLGALALGLLLLITFVIAIQVHRKAEDADNKMFVWLFAAIPLVFFGVGFGACAEKAGKAHIAPRIVVLEKISELVK